MVRIESEGLDIGRRIRGLIYSTIPYLILDTISSWKKKQCHFPSFMSHP